MGRTDAKTTIMLNMSSIIRCHHMIGMRQWSYYLETQRDDQVFFFTHERGAFYMLKFREELKSILTR